MSGYTGKTSEKINTTIYSQRFLKVRSNNLSDRKSDSTKVLLFPTIIIILSKQFSIFPMNQISIHRY